MPKYLLNICGPTAVGKTGVALYWAEKLGCPILSTDSRQCYRELGIGSAPPSQEELDRVPHHFIADRSIHDPITAGEFEQFALEILDTLFESHDIVVAVGGSGMYIDALLHGQQDVCLRRRTERGQLEDQLRCVPCHSSLRCLQAAP